MENNVMIYNANNGDNVIRISIKVANVKDKKGKFFKSVKGMKHLEVFDNDGKSIGKRNRWIDIHFTKDAFKNVPNECTAKCIDDLSTGFLYVRAKAIQSPRVYKTVVDANGEVKYPTIWVKGEILGFEPYVADQSEFDYVPSNEITAEIETDTDTDTDVDAEFEMTSND